MNRNIAIPVIIVSIVAGIAVLLLTLDNETPEIRVKGDTPNHEQKMWCIAACAVLTQLNQDRHDIPGGVERTDDNINRWMQGLSDGWGITDRESLFNSLRWIETGGHRQEFIKMGSHLNTANEIQLKELQRQAGRNPELANVIDVVEEHYARLGEKNLVGWDYSRYISLCGWGYVAGYITEDETWVLMLLAARILQDTFESWEDLGQNYLIGRQFWSLEETMENGDRYEMALRWLSSNSESPWLNIPWELDLSVTELDPGAPHDRAP